MVCNENIDYVLERDILINFILGLRQDIYEVLIEKDNLTSLESYFCEALKLEIKQEIIDEQANETFEYNVKTEAPEMKPDTKVFLEQSMDVEEDYDFMNDEDDIYLDDEEDIDYEQEEVDEKPPKPKRARRVPKTKNLSDSDYSASEHEADDDFDPSAYEENPKQEKDKECDFCGKKYATEKALKLHVSKKHTEQGMEGKKKIKCGFCELEFAERRLLTCVSSVERTFLFYFKRKMDFCLAKVHFSRVFWGWGGGSQIFLKKHTNFFKVLIGHRYIRSMY